MKDDNSASAPALVHDGGVEALSQLSRELVDFVFAIDGDGLARGIQDNLAVVALADVCLDFRQKIWVNLPVEVVRKLREEIGAGHGLGPPFFCLK